VFVKRCQFLAIYREKRDKLLGIKTTAFRQKQRKEKENKEKLIILRLKNKKVRGPPCHEKTLLDGRKGKLISPNKGSNSEKIVAGKEKKRGASPKNR